MSNFRPKSAIDTLVIHCADTPNGKFFTVEDIDRWHAERGFHRDPGLVRWNQPNLKHIGYHAVIYTAGPVTLCRDIIETGAHAYHYNRRSIGVCMIGTDKFTKAQWLTLRAYVLGIKYEFQNINVIGHNEISQKTCPGFNVQNWLAGDMQPLEDHLLTEEEESK